LARDVLLKVAAVEAFTPFTFHWYVGVPPLVGVGVKVTDVPEQTEVAEAAILIAGVKEVFTVIVTGLEVAVGVEAQDAVEVITQLTMSPLTRADEV